MSAEKPDPITVPEMADMVGRFLQRSLTSDPTVVLHEPGSGSLTLLPPATGQRFRITISEEIPA